MSSKVFVGNLSYETTQDQLTELLADVGEIKDVYLPSDRVSGRPRGFAFVEFSTEEEAKKRGIPYCVGSYPFSGAGRARCMGEKEGFVKLIAHGKTDRILGVHIIGPRAADMIAECVLALEFNASSEDIARTIHGHPTFSEALQEAAMNVRKCSIYAS